MAIVFEMWAECGTEADCAALVRHFDDFRTPLLSGRTISWMARQSYLSTAMVVSPPT